MLISTTLLMTVKEVHQLLKESLNEVLSEYEIKEHIRLIMDAVFGYSSADVILNGEQELTLNQLKQIEKIIKELSSSKPLQYILGYTYFYGREFFVDERALIPRPETEELTQIILEREKEKSISVLDIGTGSACIPISLKLEGRYHEVEGLEVSKPALELAKENANKLEADVHLFQMDILSQVPDKFYDVVVSNPPYVKREELNDLDSNVVEFEPVIALAPQSDDPLLFYKRMLEINDQILKKGGRLYWEIHEDLGPEVLNLLSPDRFSNIELKEDMFGRDRFVFAVKL